MLFNSVIFLGFFPVVWVVHWLLKSPQRQVPWLLVASIVFYGWWDYRFLGLIAISVVVDYLCGLGLGAAGSPSKRRAILGISIVVNLGLLGLFKYFDFFADSAADLLEMIGLHPDRITLELILPLGISFYTFQTLGYTIDVYRRAIEPCRDPVLFATFVTFFPQLVAGPIERASRLIPRLAAQRRFAMSDQAAGLLLIIQGYFKKLVIADNLGLVVDHVFADGGAPASPWLVVFGAWAFAFQIYGDFSGYSDIARGLARCLGIELLENFRAPYLARNPAEFWNRWHISLSTWLRDYLYIPLGGNRGSSGKTYRNLMLTMVLGGLWHGAASTFLLWGLFHGALLVIHRGIPKPDIGGPVWWRRVRGALAILVMFHLTLIGWVLFRAESLEQVVAMVATMGASWSFNDEVLQLMRHVLHFVWPVALLQVVRYTTGRTPAESGLPIVSWVCAAYMLIHIYTEGVLDRGAQFIYFQF